MTNIDFLLRTTEDIIGKQELLDKLAAGKKLRIKYGVDVTAPFLHLGHAVNLWMMRWLQEQGHKVLFLIGNFTTRIGDPTGKSKTRKTIDPKTIEANAEEFIEQVSRVLLTDPDVFEIYRNGDWYDEMPLGEWFQLLGRITHGRLVQRNMFQKRIADGEPIHMHEFLYPLLQGWDSVELKSDLTIVGNDQLFNEMVGRTFQQQEGQDPQAIITTIITPGLCGKEKQSKSLGNYVALSDTPRNKFGKVMSLPDNLIKQWFLAYTDVSVELLNKVDCLEHPMASKLDLAAKIVERYHGKEAAQAERDWFRETFSKNKLPEKMPSITVPLSSTLLEVLKECKPDASNSDLRRLLKQGAVRLIDVRAKFDHIEHRLSLDNLNDAWDLPCVGPGGLPANFSAVLKIGKRSWFTIINEI
jgi:tyrosyl-tRNA synthetase